MFEKDSLVPYVIEQTGKGIELSHLINGNYLKRASPKAANIHNRW